MTELHPIQLHDITVSRLSVVVRDHAAALSYGGEVDLNLQRGTSDFEFDDPTVAVGLRATVKPVDSSDEDAIFFVEVELSGQFTIDYSKFDFEDVPRWAEVNAPMLLLPYVREQIYGIALRAGLRQMMIPLLVAQRGAKRQEPQKSNL